MAKRHKRRLFTGAVCTQIVYTVSDGADPKTSRPKKPRFQSQEERDEFNSKQSLNRLVALMNANFTPTSLYSTLTLDAENEVHTAEEMRRVRDNLVRRMQYHYPEAKNRCFLRKRKNNQSLPFTPGNRGDTGRSHRRALGARQRDRGSAPAKAQLLYR